MKVSALSLSIINELGYNFVIYIDEINSISARLEEISSLESINHPKIIALCGLIRDELKKSKKKVWSDFLSSIISKI